MASCTQIDNLLQGYIDNELAHSERVIFEQHLAECQTCQALLRQQQRSSAELFEVFSDYKLARDLTKGVIEHLPNMEAAIIDVQGVNWRAKHPAVYRERALRLVPVAVIVLLAVMAGVLRSNWPDPVMAAGTIGAVTHKAGQANRTVPEMANAELKTIVMPGERYETDPNSTLMLSLLGPTHIKMAGSTWIEIKDDRTISMEKGRAYFTVSHGLQPFRVNTPSGKITVIGTEFDVIVNNRRTVVTVLKGIVSLTNGTVDNNFNYLEAGERMTVELGKEMTSPKKVNADRLTQWAKAIEPDADAMAFFRSKVLPRGPVQEIEAERGPYSFPVDNRSLTSITLSWTEEPFSYEQPCGYEVYVYTMQDRKPIFREILDASLFQHDSGITEYSLQNTGDMSPKSGYIMLDLIPDCGPGDREINFDLPRAVATKEN